MALQDGTQLGNISMALQNLGAGIQGTLPQLQASRNQTQELQQRQQMMQQAQAQQQQQAQQQAAIERQKTVFTDANAALNLLEAGNLDGVVGLGMQRLQLLQQFPGADPSDTQRLTRLAIAAKNGSEEAKTLLRDELKTTVEIGRELGVIERPQSQTLTSNQVIDGRVVRQAPDGTITSEQVPGMSPKADDPIAQLRARAVAGGLAEGTPQFQSFMLQGGTSRDTAKDDRIANIIPQLKEQFGYTDEQAEREARNIADGNINYEVLESGQVRRVDKVSGEVREVPVASSGQEIPAPEPGRTLYALADQATGPASAVRAGLARVGVPNDEAVMARTELRNSMQELVRSLAVNPRFPVSEIERIRKDTDLDPAIIDNPTAMRARMRGLESYLSRRQAQAERDASDPSLPQEIRENQASNASSIRNFRAVMGVPSTLDPDFLSTPQAVQQIDNESLRYFAENASDEDLNALPDEVAEAIVRKLGGGR